MTIYGYARISTKKQSLQRQINNIEAYNKDAIIYEEEFTGRKVEGRKEFQKLLKKVKANDTIIFDSVSRMSRNADEGIKLYMDLFDRGVNLIFLNEMHINTDTYKNALGKDIPRVSEDQSKVGQAVSRENLQPGDLVFFDTMDKGKVSRVGMYIGNNEFIHAANSKKGVIKSTLTGYYDKKFINARRP